MKNILKQLNQRPIAYYPIYHQVTESLHGAVLLSQLMYWLAKKDKIHKTNEELMNELGFSERELKTAKKALKKATFIIVSREGLPAKTYYSIDWKEYEKCLGSVQSSQDETVPTGKDETVPTLQDETVPTYRTESSRLLIDETRVKTTTETTTETIPPCNPPGGKSDDRKLEEPQELPPPLQEWIAYRKEIRKPLKARTIQKLFKDYETDPIGFASKVEHSISNGYQGLFSPKNRTPSNRGHGGAQPGSLGWMIENGMISVDETEGYEDAEVIN